MKTACAKLLALVICALLLAAPCAALEPSAGAQPEIAAPSAVLMERETG